MAQYEFQTRQIRQYLPVLRAGDTVLLTGTVYTAGTRRTSAWCSAWQKGSKRPSP